MMTETPKASPTEDQIKQMVTRFLSWKLPEDFRPDCGIEFDADKYVKLNPINRRFEPIGTNLFSAAQAEKMVRHMLAVEPPTPAPDAPRTPALDAVEHTLEPWRCHDPEYGGETEIYGEGNPEKPLEHVASVNEYGNNNARRIVACVNALAGISTADIEAGAVRKLVEAARFAFHAMSFADAIEEHNRLQAALLPFTAKGKPNV